MHIYITGIFVHYSKCSKFLNTFLFLFSDNMLVLKAGAHKTLVRLANRRTLNRLLLQKQSDLGLHFLYILFFGQVMFEILERLPYIVSKKIRINACIL